MAETQSLQRDLLRVKGKIREVTKFDIVVCVYYWLTWAFLLVILVAQMLCITGFTVQASDHKLYGENPALNPKAAIPGMNDEPFTDRMVTCISTGQGYKPVMLSEALKDESVQEIDTEGKFIDGYRVVTRDTIKALDPATYALYVHQCSQLAETQDAIFDNCDSIGYNVSRKEGLRVVEDTSPKTMKWLPNALPIMIKPFWDQALVGHAIANGQDGESCIFRLYGKYLYSGHNNGTMAMVRRDLRAKKTVEWLGLPGGSWRNGWYQDPSGMNWYSDIMTTGHGETPLGLTAQVFDPFNKVKINCEERPDACGMITSVDSWGSKFAITGIIKWFDNVAISNGSRYGLFLFEAENLNSVKSVYDLQTFLANISMALILLRWFICMLALHNGYRFGVTNWYNAGIGCLSCARSFNMLPIMAAPRLKILLAAFWTCGGYFEGNQMSLSETWYVIYPSLAVLIMMYFSLINIVAKAFYRRFTDKLFTPTLLFFCLMHYFRLTIGETQVFGFDSRISTVVLSDEFDQLSTFDLLTTSAALRMNGNVLSLFLIKIAVLALNLVPLLFSENMTTSGDIYTAYMPCDVERALALRASNVGGLGTSCVYVGERNGDLTRRVSQAVEMENGVGGWTKTLSVWKSNALKKPKFEPECGTSAAATSVVLNSYEVVRLGYLIFGGQFMISFDDWYIVTSLAPLRFVDKLWNHRITLFQVTLREDGFYLSPHAQLCRVDDPRLMTIPFYDVSVCAFK